MPKPWAKLEIGYLGHPKFLALNANAICLWHEGKNYCDTHLTDGLIPRDAMKMFRFRGAKAIALLLASCGQKPDGTPYAALWDAHLLGYRMHDYLEHNDCREAVLARMERAEEKREENRGRQVEWRAREKERREQERRQAAVTESPPVTQNVTRYESSDSNAVVTGRTESVSVPETSTRTNTAAAPRRVLASEPNENGNYRVIEKLAIDVLSERGFTDESEFVDLVKSATARLSIDYGREVDPDVVHRACSSAVFKFRNPQIARKA